LGRVAGELILFTDDDILPCADWLTQYAAAAAAQPDIDLFGGPVLLKWPGEPPSWAVCDNTVRNWCFANSDHPSAGTGPWSGALLGGNFAVRKSAQIRLHGFDSDKGPTPGDFAMGNEAEFIARLRRAGHRAWWIQDATVEHIVRPEQIDKEWMLHRAVWAGRGTYWLGVASEGPPKSIAGLPRWLGRAVVVQLGRIASAWIRRDERDWFVARWYLNYYAGMFIEARHMRAASTAGNRRTPR
jgi:hypothetical protein